jgi:putative transposase
VSGEVLDLTKKMSVANPRWGAPRIHSELLRLGIAVSQATVATCLIQTRKLPSETWRTILKNHVNDLVSANFFTVPTVRFQIQFVFGILAHHRRRPPYFAVTANPTVKWMA